MKSKKQNVSIKIQGNKNIITQIFGPSKVNKNSNYSNQNSKYKNVAFTGVLVSLLTASVLPWWFIPLQNLVTGQKSILSEVSSTESSKSGQLRKLEPLETGKKISELPNGVYFFAYSALIYYEILNPEKDYLDVSNNEIVRTFEIQKIEGRYFLVGFISNEAFSRLGIIKEVPLTTVLFSNRWKDVSNLIAIPFDAITKIKVRTIDLDTGPTDVFDITFNEVKNKPEFHKKRSL